jgi:hypothetical protein
MTDLEGGFDDARRELGADPRVLVVVEVAAARRLGPLPFSFGVRVVEVEERLAAHETKIHGPTPDDDRTDLEAPGQLLERLRLALR